MQPSDRFLLAANLSERCLDEFISISRIFANNEIVLRSELLSSQIPTSYAANAFNELQRSLAVLELAKICTLWEKPDLDNYSLLTILELADCEEVSDLVWSDHRDSYPTDYQLGTEYAKLGAIRHRQAVRFARLISRSNELKRARNTRHKQMHSIDRTRDERKEVIKPSLNRDAAVLFRAAKISLDRFNSSLRGASFDFDGLQQMHSRHASSLWSGVRLSVKD